MDEEYATMLGCTNEIPHGRVMLEGDRRLLPGVFNFSSCSDCNSEEFADLRQSLMVIPYVARNKALRCADEANPDFAEISRIES